MSTLLSKVLRFKSPSILVIGDYMLDEIVFGDAERLSPDAPVPVLEMRNVQSRAGGAGNVARCLIAMGARVECLGIVGNDKEGELLSQLLNSEGIEYRGEYKYTCTVLYTGILYCTRTITPAFGRSFGVLQESRATPELWYRYVSEPQKPVPRLPYICVLGIFYE